MGPPDPGAALQGITLWITSDVTGSTVLGRCSFLLALITPTDDADGDGITNAEELQGLRNAQGDLVLMGNGQPAADFPALGANPCRKDLFIQLDYVTGTDGHDHRFTQDALDKVIASFDTAPIPAPPGGACPFPGHASGPGIHLVIEQRGVPEDAQATDCGGIDFSRFDPARRPYFIYALSVHSIPGGYSGLGPCGGPSGARTFLVGVGGDTSSPYFILLQAGTFMHQLGHTLGLGHGGDSGVNLKPNYLSVMNYSFQTGISNGSGQPRIDYSRDDLPTLDERALDEQTGIGGPSDLWTRWWGPAPGYRYPQRSTAQATGELDWNQDGRIDATPASADVNSDGLCVGPGANAVSDSPLAGDDVRTEGEIRNGADHVCDSRPAGDDTLGPSPENACVLPGVNGVRETALAGDDIAVSNGNYVGVGADFVCDSVATGDDRQFTGLGSGEPLLNGFDDWSAIDWRIGPSRQLPPRPGCRSRPSNRMPS